MPLSLRLKINAAILITFFLITLLFIGVLLPLQENQFQASLNNAELLMQSLVLREENPLANEILERRYGAIQLRIEEMLRIDRLNAIEVFTRTGKPISGAGEIDARAELSGEKRRSVESDGAASTILKDKHHRLVYLHRIRAFGEVIGYIRMQYGVEDIFREHNHAMLVFGGFLVATLLVMLVLLNLQLSRVILAPIAYLIKTMRRVQEEGPGHRVEIKSMDEIGILSSTFNKMSVALSESYRKIENQGQELQDTKNYLDNIINSMPSVIVGVAKNGRVTQWNDEAEKQTGLGTAEVLGHFLYEVFPLLGKEMRTIKQAIDGEKIMQKEKHARDVDGERRYADITIYPLIPGNVQGAVIRMDDVTDRVRLEEMMIQSEKMVSVGGLAAGMAHEINNPLAGIMQNLQVLQRRISARLPKNIRNARTCGTTIEAVHAYMQRCQIPTMLDTIRDSGQRAVVIVKNMLSFSRKSESDFDYHHLADLIDKTIELARNDYDLKIKYDFRKIEICREYCKNLPQVYCEGSKIQQVVLNIVKNGSYAMLDNQATSHDKAPPRLTLRTAMDGPMAIMEIEDNGRGMEEKVKKRIFEPFFTTKGVGQGTGLGLSVSYFIITENHGGTVAVESHPGMGTKFILKLPIQGQKS